MSITTMRKSTTSVSSNSSKASKPKRQSALGSTSLVEKAISSVVYPKRSNGLIDILEPRTPLLPVELPSIPKIRHQIPQGAQQPPRKSTRGSIEVPFIEGDDATNPFTYPKNVEQFVKMLDEFKAKDRERLQNIPTLMKGTKGFRQTQIVLARIKPFLQPTFKHSLAADYKKVIWRAQHGLGINHLQKVSRKMHSEYIMQRKEIYYLRRAIRVRKMALDMLQQAKEIEEENLSKYEWLTDFTKEALETFLRENDEETHRAGKRAEAQLRAKLDKALEVRQLSIQINQLKSDIVGTNEGLRECKSFMGFLNDIAQEIMRKDEEEEHRIKRREEQVKEELVEYMKEGTTLKEAKEMVQKKATSYLNENEDQNPDRENEIAVDNRDTISVANNNGSAEFIADISRVVRKNIGLPEEITEPPPEPMPKGRKAKKEFLLKKRMQKRAPPTSNEIAGSLVQRHVSHLTPVTAEHEREMLIRLMESQAVVKESQASETAQTSVPTLSRTISGSSKKPSEDADGYDEKALLASLDLVPGSDKSDNIELAELSFTRPSQLLAIYSDMEEANLSLIQHSQASEELLEKVQGEISEARKKLNDRGKLLRDEISTIQAGIDMDEERAKALGMLFEMFTGGNYDVRKQQKLYRILQKHIAKVYAAAVGTVDHHLNPTMMLTSVEKNFEDLMKEIKTMPDEVVLQISRELDKERRETDRVEQVNRKKQVYDERKTRSIARAEAPIRKKKGRPLLFRSNPQKTIIQLSQADLEKKAEEDEFNYFFGP